MTHFPRTDIARATLVLLAASLSVLVTAAAWPSAAAAATRAPVNAYRGLGAWVDIYDPGAWNDPEAAVADMARHKVRTIFIETANYHAAAAIYRPASLDRFIHAAHARGMKVVAWYLPGFKDTTKDYNRSKAAIQYRTSQGQKFDSFALDIEASIVKPASTRTTRCVNLSKKIRKLVGSRYPLGGIIPSPVGMQMHSTYWPDFPYRQLWAVYDVIVPMCYSSYHGDGYAKAYYDTTESIRIIRRKVGSSRVRIHLIGGVANRLSSSETRGVVRGTREYGILGAGLYDWAITGDEDWKQLVNVRVNPRQSPALPVGIGYGDALGNLPGDRSHPKEVFYEAGGMSGAHVLKYRLFDAQKGEVRLLVNWKDMGALPRGASGKWTAVRSTTVPATALRSGRNLIGFVARGTYPTWRVWGVRVVEMAPAP